MAKASNLEQAKEWCDQARAFLGIAVPFSDAKQMKNRVKEVNTKVVELDKLVKAKKNQKLTQEYQAIESKYRELAGEAHGILENVGLPKSEKEELIKTVSGNLNILGAQIRQKIAEVSGDTKGAGKIDKEIEALKDPQAQREFEDKGRELMLLVETMKPVATSDVYSTTKTECSLFIDECREEELWVPAKTKVIDKINSVGERVTKLKELQADWLKKKNEIGPIDKALEPIPDLGMLGHEKQTIAGQLRQAEGYGEQRNFTGAIGLVDICQTRITILKKSFEDVKTKVSDFNKAEASYRQLLSSVSTKRAKMMEALKKTKHQGMQLPITPEIDPVALKGVDQPARQFERLVNDYKHATTTFQGWEGYPGQVDVAKANLEKALEEIDNAYFKNKNPQQQEEALQQMAVKAIKDDILLRRKQDSQRAYDTAHEQVTTAMSKLESALGPVHADVKEFAKKIKAAEKEFDTDPGPSVVDTLRQLTTEIDTKTREFVTEKRNLVNRRNELAGQWNENFSVWRSFRIPSKYLEALSNEFDLLAATYVDTVDNLDTMREGVAKIERVVTRLKEVMKNNTAVRQSRTLFDEIGKLLKNKTLPTNQALKLAELQGRHEELDKSGAIDTEDPSTLHPKLEKLKQEVEAAITDAGEVARLRGEVKNVFDLLAPLFTSVKQKIAARFIWLPDDYVISFEAEARMVLQKANTVEVPLKVQAQKTDLENIKTKLEGFDKLKPQELADHLTRVERPNLDLEIEKKEHTSKLIEEWGKLLLSYETKVLPDAIKAADQNFFSRTFGEDKLKDVKERKKQAEKFAAEEKYADAVATIKIAIALANSIINAPNGSKIAESLRDLDAQWKAAATNLKTDLGAMIEAVRASCEETKSGSSGKIVTALEKSKTEFDTILDQVDTVVPLLRSLAGQTAPNPRATAEKVLQVVRQHQSVLENPVMKNFAGNPFSVAVRVVPLSQKLRTLDYHLRCIA